MYLIFVPYVDAEVLMFKLEMMTLPGSKERSLAVFNRRMLPYYFLLPTILLVLVMVVWPVLNVIYYSFQNYNPNKPWAMGPAGLDNYIKVLTKDEYFWSSVIISVKWCVWEVLLQLVFGMIFALVLNSNFRGRGFARALTFAPWALSGVMVSILWALIYNQNIGVLNDIFIKMHIIARPLAWVANPGTAFGAVVNAELWRGIPFFAISLLAAMQSIPLELFESCEIDGGGRITKFIYIILPFLKDTIILTTLLRFIWEFNSVDLIYNLTGGGPMGLTSILSMYLTSIAISAQDFGYGSAIGMITFVMIMGLAIVYIKLSRFEEVD